MNNIDALKKISNDLKYIDYCLSRCNKLELTPYQKEVMEHYGMKEPVEQEPIYDYDDLSHERKSCKRLAKIYYEKEFDI